MDIQEFIQDTLEQIINATIETNKKFSSVGATIEHVNHPCIDVSFHLCIESSDAKKEEGEGKVKLQVLGIGGNLSNEKTDKSINQIQFSIPLCLPEPEKPRYAH